MHVPDSIENPPRGIVQAQQAQTEPRAAVMNRKKTESNCLFIKSPRLIQGHTLVEVMVALSVLAFMLVSLYAGFSSGFAVLRLARENLRATQVLEERMEVIRLVSWKDLLSPGFIPTEFSAPFYATDGTNTTPGGFDYTGTVTIGKAPIKASYADHLRMIQIDLTWISGNVQRRRQMNTYVSEYGIQNYVY